MKRRGVVAASAGNHAQGVAYASSLLGIASTIIMPEGASIAGQGTIGLEILEDVPGVEGIIIPVGGGVWSPGLPRLSKRKTRE
jgi:threonine dehydratase